MYIIAYYCPNCMRYHNTEGVEVPEKQALENCKIHRLFCCKECEIEFND